MAKSRYNLHRKGNPMTNPTHRRYPRTLAEAFPRHPNPDFVEEEPLHHRIGDWGLAVFLIVIPVLIWWA